jgi:hypothetical protein
MNTLQWGNHLQRMEDKRLLKMAFYYMLKNVEQVRRQEESWFDHV